MKSAGSTDSLSCSCLTAIIAIACLIGTSSVCSADEVWVAGPPEVALSGPVPGRLGGDSITVTQKDEQGVAHSNTVSWTAPPSTLRPGQQVTLKISCTASPGDIDWGGVGGAWNQNCFGGTKWENEGATSGKGAHHSQTVSFLFNPQSGKTFIQFSGGKGDYTWILKTWRYTKQGGGGAPNPPTPDPNGALRARLDVGTLVLRPGQSSEIATFWVRGFRPRTDDRVEVFVWAAVDPIGRRLNAERNNTSAWPPNMDRPEHGFRLFFSVPRGTPGGESTVFIRARQNRSGMVQLELKIRVEGSFIRYANLTPIGRAGSRAGLEARLQTATLTLPIGNPRGISVQDTVFVRGQRSDTAARVEVYYPQQSGNSLPNGIKVFHGSVSEDPSNMPVNGVSDNTDYPFSEFYWAEAGTPLGITPIDIIVRQQGHAQVLLRLIITVVPGSSGGPRSGAPRQPIPRGTGTTPRPGGGSKSPIGSFVDLPNGGFENGLTRPWGTGQYSDGRSVWWNSGGCRSVAQADDSIAHIGRMSLHISNPTPRAANTFGTTQRSVAVVPGQKYRISLWARGSLVSNGAVKIAVDKEWNVVPISLPLGLYEWRQFTGYFTPTTNAADLRIITEDRCEAWIDDIVIIAVN